MPITQEVAGGNCLIRLEGDIDVSTSCEFKRILVEAITSAKKLQMDASAATDLDVTAMQLLWATAREAGKRGVGFEIAPVPDALRAAFVSVGFDGFMQAIVEPKELTNPASDSGND